MDIQTDILTDKVPSALPRWREGLVPVVVGWLWARACLVIGFAISNPLGNVLDTPKSGLSFHEMFFMWDGAYYRDIANHWYGSLQPDAARFFPVYPELARLLRPVFGGNTEWALLAINNFTAFLGAWVLWRLVVEVLGSSAELGPGENGWLDLRKIATPGWDRGAGSLESKLVADRSAWLVAIFPAAFVLALAYTEGLALLLCAATLLALHRRGFVLAGLLAFAAAALRPVGGLLLVPIVIELWRTRPRPAPWRWVVAVGGPLAGFVAAMLWIERSTHDLMIPFRLQQEIRGGFQDPVTRVLEPMGEILKGNFRDTYNLGFMLVLLFLGYQAVKRRQPLSWIAFAALSLVVLLSSQVTDSLGRYGLVVVPFVVALAQWADRRWRQVLVAAGSSVGLIWLTSEALLTRMVP
ncbi:MAG TPA: hypothetical protein VL068_09255 [Microthrixaceae bacterium]|nr:hypothetical protein [Microthrixaceae bacterium]